MITSDQTWRNTKLREWIGYYEDIVPKDGCESLIEVTKNSGQLKPSKYSNHAGKIKLSHKRVVMDDMWVKDKTTSSIINDFFSKVIRKYSDKFERFSCQRHSGFRVNRYSVGGFMSEHKIAYLESVIKYIDGILKSIQSRQWDIKNAISWRQFEAGMM